jgi:hypothetical protein
MKGGVRGHPGPRDIDDPEKRAEWARALEGVTDADH